MPDYFGDYPIPRNPTAFDFPKKFELDAPADSILSEASPIQMQEDGKLDIYSSPTQNIILMINLLNQDNIEEVVDNCSKFANNIFGLNLSGVMAENEVMEKFVREVLSPTKLTYLVDLNLSYISLTYESLFILCETISPIKSGYCSIKRLAMVRAGYIIKLLYQIYQHLRKKI
jgi:hypothetical protein